jgi:lipid II:glycine glycyltransferase (peptidoglycan interpeptide bridge formation enzyme)
MWKALDSTCRNRVRKAIKAGLTAEDVSDEVIADEFYDHYTDVMRRKGLRPPYPREQARLLFRHLKKADLLFALRIRDAEGNVLATGLYPHDDRSMYFWGGASVLDGRDLCPNEFLHWSAMRLGAQRGITCYNMCGSGRFKKKFGGVLITRRRWHKCFSLAATWSRNLYWLYFSEGQRLRRRLDNLFRKRQTPQPQGAD